MVIPQLVYPLTSWWTSGLFHLRLLQILWLQTLTYKFLYGYMFSFLMGKYLRSSTAESYGKFSHIVWDNVRFFSKVGEPFCNPTSNIWKSSSYSTSLSTLHVVRLLNFSHSTKFVVICISLLTSDTEYLFRGLLVILLNSFLKYLFKFFAYFYNKLLIFLLLIIRVLYIF